MVSYLQVEGLVKSFGDRVLFENLSLGVGEGQRIGLIAKNGTGKTTLLNIIAGREDYEAGRITFRRDLKVAYLEQNPAFPEGTTVLDACFLADSPALRAVAAYEQAVASADEDVLHRAMAEMDAQDAWNYESRVKQILTQLKIKDFDQPTGQLSGGQVKRVALANALIAEPDLLILDEPTNHLDLEMTEWLEEYLAHTRLSLLMVTHDRYFLDRVCSDIVEIDDRQAYVYHGNYSLYLEKRQRPMRNASAITICTVPSWSGFAGSRKRAGRKRVRGSSRSANSRNGCASAARAEMCGWTSKRLTSGKRSSRCGGFPNVSATR